MESCGSCHGDRAFRGASVHGFREARRPQFIRKMTTRSSSLSSAVPSLPVSPAAIGPVLLSVIRARFDLVVNIDGFNQVVLSVQDNTRKQVFPFYSRNWFIRTQNVSQLKMLQALGRLSLLAERRQSLVSESTNLPSHMNHSLPALKKCGN